MRNDTKNVITLKPVIYSTGELEYSVRIGARAAKGLLMKFTIP
jgi:hypothetical protein